MALGDAIADAFVRISPDDTGFTQKLRSAVAAAVSQVEAEVKVTVDTSNLRREVAAAVKGAGTGQNVHVGLVGPDGNELRREVAKAAKLASGEEVEVEVGLMDAGLRQQVNASIARAGFGQKIEVPVVVDNSSARSALSDLRRGLKSTTSDARSLRAMMATLAVPAAAAGITALAGAVTALGGAAIGAASALAPLSGLVGALPGLLGGAIQGFGVGAIAASGMGDALKAVSAAETAAARAATSGGATALAAARARETAARAITDANRGLEDAQRSAGRAAADAARDVVSASRAIEDAQAAMARTADDAAERMTSATRAVEDAQSAASRAAEVAADRITSATRNVEDAQESAARTTESASERAADARQRLADVIERTADNIANALERVGDAEERLADSQRDATDAQNALNKARETATERLERMRREFERGSMDEEAAVLRVAEAEGRLADLRSRAQVPGESTRFTRSRPESDFTALEVAQADLAHRQALQRLKEVREERQRDTAELAKAEAAGVDGADNVVNAQRRLEDATKAVGDAEENVADAQEEAQKAALDGIKARENAQRDLDQVIRDGSRAEEAALRRVKDAQDALTDTIEDNGRAAEAAARRVKDAQDALAETIEDNAQAEEAALRRVQDARDGMARTLEMNSRSAEDAGRGIESAQRRIADALRDATRAGEEAGAAIPAAFHKMNEELAGLSPAGRDFVEVLRSYRPALEELQAAAQTGLFPLLTIALRNLEPLLPIVRDAIFDTAVAMGELAVKGSELLSSGPFQADLPGIFEANVRVIEGMGTAFWNLVDALRNVMVAAQPLVDRIVGWVVSASEAIRVFMQEKRDSGELEGFFNRAGDVAARVGGIMADLGVTLYNVGTAAADLGEWLLTSLENAAAGWREWTGSAAGQDSMRQGFEDMRPVLTEVAGLVGDLLGIFVRLAQEPGTAALISQVRDTLLPALEELAVAVSGELGPKLVEFATSIVDLFSALSSSGALELVLTVLGGIADTISELLLNNPDLATFVGYFAATAAVIRGVKFVGMITGFSQLSGILEPLGDFILPRVWDGLKLVAGFIAGLSAPILIALAVVAALTAGVVLLYRENETFRDIVQRVWEAIQQAIDYAWNRVIKPTWDALVGFITGPLWRAILTFKDFAIEAWRLIQVAIDFAWNRIIQPIWHAIEVFIVNVLLAVFTDLREMAETVWGAIHTAVSASWTLIRPIWEAIERFLDVTLTGAFNGISAIVSTVWGAITTAIQGTWTAVEPTLIAFYNYLSGPLTTVWEGIRDAARAVFNGISSGISGAVDGIRSIISGFLNAVAGLADTIGLDNIAAALRAAANFVVGKPANANWGQAAPPGSGGGGGGAQRLAAGGMIPRALVGLDGGGSIPFGEVGPGFVTQGARAVVGEGNANHPEFVIPTDPKYRSRAEALTATLLDTLAGGMPHHASGGVLGFQHLAIGGWLKDKWDDAVGGAVTVGRAIGGVGSRVSKAVFEKAKEIAAGAVERLWPMLGVPEGRITGFVPASINSARQGVIDKLRGQAETVGSAVSEAYKQLPDDAGFTPGRGAGGGGGRGYTSGMLAARDAILRLFGRMTVGGYVDRNIAGTRKKSAHARWRAWDFMTGRDTAKGNRIANWLLENGTGFGLKGLIWNDRQNWGRGWRNYDHPAGGNNPTLEHRDHVHAEFFRRGGLVTEPTLGVLAEAGREAVIPLDDRRAMQALSAALYDTPFPARSGPASTPAGTAAGSVTLTVSDLESFLRRVVREEVEGSPVYVQVDLDGAPVRSIVRAERAAVNRTRRRLARAGA